MYRYVQSPQYYSSDEIAWIVFDKYFASNNPHFCAQEETEYIFQAFLKTKQLQLQQNHPQLWHEKLNSVIFIVAISLILKLEIYIKNS